MLPVILCICLGIFAAAVLIAMAGGASRARRVGLRLAALDREIASPQAGDGMADIRKDNPTMSSIPWLNSWMTRMNLGPVSSLYLYQSGVTLSIGSLLSISLAGAAVLGYILYWQLEAAPPALLLSAGFLPLPFFYVRSRRTRRLSKLEQQIPDALGMMVSGLRVGHSLIACLGSAARECPDPIGVELRKCFEEQNYGVDVRTALLNLIDRAPVQDLRIFVAAVLIQKDSGGNLAEVLEKVAQTIRERFRLKMQVRVHTAQGRMTGWVLSLLPVVLGVGMYIVSPEGISVLWKRPVGLKLLYAAIGMDVLGAIVIRKIVGIRI
jgi:tight adherence protein B